MYPWDRVSNTTHEAGQTTHGKAEHNHRVEHADVNAEFQSISCHDPK